MVNGVRGGVDTGVAVVSMVVGARSGNPGGCGGGDGGDGCGVVCCPRCVVGNVGGQGVC